MRLKTAAVIGTFGTVVAMVNVAFADTPQALAGRMEQALRTGNVDALVASAPGLAEAPTAQQFTLLDVANDCVPGVVVCSAAIRPLDPKWAAQQTETTTAAGLEMLAKPEGLVEITGRAAQEKDPTNLSMKVLLPYAKVGAAYGIVTARYTAARLAQLKSVTARSAADATLAAGVFDNTTGETDMQWVKKAKALPPGGGEPGRAFLAGVKATAAGVKAGDVDGVAKARGEWGARVLGPTDFANRTRPLAERQRRLRAQAVRFVLEASVAGGYELGDLAVLTIEGTNGAGARVIGALKMRREGGVWQEVDSASLVESPKGH